MNRPAIMVMLGILQAGCAAAVPPSSLVQLEAVTSGEDAASAAAAAGEAWSEAVRYLRMAEEQLRRRDVEGADRLAVLGTIQARLAMTALEESRARRSLEELDALQRQVRMDLERLESDVDLVEHELERGRIRRHLVRVVDETRRRAAADEEAAEERAGEPTEARTKARLEVGAEILARATVELTAVLGLNEAGAVEAERLAAMAGAVRLAGASLADGDLAAVQRHAERAGVEGRRIRSELWDDGGNGALSGLAERMRTAGLEAVVEDPAVAMPFDQFSKSADRLGALVSAATGDADGFLCLVIVSAGGGPGGRKASDRTGQRAAEIGGRLTAAGIPDRAVKVLGTGAARPSLALSESRESAAILLIPVPSARRAAP